ncbi:MAG: aminomethyl-transferring glycine dehydrogenase subunit GcvPA [Mariprofundales bacterium]
MRYLPHSNTDRKQMLATIGVNNVRQLFADVPDQLLLDEASLNLADAACEADIVRKFHKAAAANSDMNHNACFLGAGTYHHFIPAAVEYIISRGEFLTAYTPYQPEISQGTLQSLFEFQTMIARLLAMDVANASMYDAATAIAEAALMAQRIKKRKKIVISEGVQSHWRAVTHNYLYYLNTEIISVPVQGFATDVTSLAAAVDKKTACVIVQYPDMYGAVTDLQLLRERCDEVGALLVVTFADAISFGLLTPPGKYGADIVAGPGQSLGIAMSYGGPHLGLFACKKKYMRQMPGRVCGLTKDSDGKRSFVLTLSTREQHIRREKATSNICSNQGLMTVAAGVYMALLGDNGLYQTAQNCAAAMQYLSQSLPPQVTAASGIHFHENVFSFIDNKTRERFLERARQDNIFAGIPLEKLEKTPASSDCRHLLVSTTEMLTKTDIDSFISLLKESSNGSN